VPDAHEIALQREQLFDRGVVVARLAADDDRLEELDPIAERVHHREILVDHCVEERVQQETRGVELSLAEPLLDDLPSRALALVHRDDRVVLHEDRDLVLAHDPGGALLDRVEDDEVVVVVRVDLRPLMTLLRVLDRERVQTELLRGKLEVRALRIGDVEPARPVA
jgi:hypothetical protein